MRDRRSNGFILPDMLKELLRQYLYGCRRFAPKGELARRSTFTGKSWVAAASSAQHRKRHQFQAHVRQICWPNRLLIAESSANMEVRRRRRAVVQSRAAREAGEGENRRDTCIALSRDPM